MFHIKSVHENNQNKKDEENFKSEYSSNGNTMEKCDYCVQSFKNLSELITHISQEHSEIHGFKNSEKNLKSSSEKEETYN